MLTDTDRDAFYTACAEGINSAGRSRESLFLARLALLLADEVGDLAACRRAIDAALENLPEPSLST
jgi:Protein of unknown function (DUF2783)